MTRVTRAGFRADFLKRLRSCFQSNRLGDLLVRKGRLSHDSLRAALALQRQTAQPLGEILIGNDLITRRQLQAVLVRQRILRAGAALLIFAASFGTLGAKRAQADLKDVPGEVSIALQADLVSFSSAAAWPGVFGTDEKRSESLGAFTKWSGMLSRFERQINDPSERVALAAWQSRLASFRGLPMKAMAEHVNDVMNEKPYIIDQRNWGTSDYWETPLEFMARGGDCEDFAIAKYVALRALGVPEERLRVAIVQDTQKNIPHAILIINTGGRLYALDNQMKYLIDAESPGRYRPIFSINRQAWWLHTSLGSTQIAAR